MSFCYSYPSKEEKRNRVHSLSSPGLVRFSWEEEPGISKTMPPPSMEFPATPVKDPKLSPPPSQVQVVTTKVAAVGDLNTLNLPPPPCGLKQRDSLRNGYKRRSMKHQDPFLTALVECTRSVGGHQKDKKKGGGSGRRVLVGISCRHSCAVKDGNMVRIPHNGHLLSSCSAPVHKQNDHSVQKGEERVLAPIRK